MRIPEVKAAGHRAARVVGVAVDLHVVREEMAKVPEQLQVVLASRRAPHLGRVAQVRIAGRDNVLRPRALHAAAGRRGLAILKAEVRKPARAERQAGIPGHRERLPTAADPVTRMLDVAEDTRPAGGRVARVRIAEGAGAKLQTAARGGILEQEVHDAGDRIRAVLCRRAVAQHFGLPNGNPGDHGEIRALRAVRDAVPEPGNDRCAVAALAVDQDQRVIGCQVAQVRRPDDGRRVADWLNADVERGDDGPQLLGQVRTALADEILVADDIDRHGRGGHRPGLGAGPDDDHLLGTPDRHLHVEGDRGAAAHLHHLRGRGEAGEGERHVVRPRDKSAERELAGPVGDGHLRAPRRGLRFHGDAGENAARRVGDRPGDRRVLGAGHAGRKHADGKHQDQRKACLSVATQFHHRAVLVARGFIGHTKNP